MASRNEPAPASSRLVTMNVAGAIRDSRNSIMLVLPWVCDGRTVPSNVIGNALPPRLRNLHPPLTKTSRDRVSARSTSLVSPLHPGHPNKALLAFQLCFAELFAAHRH